MRCTLALRALPVYLREDDTEFYKTCNVSIRVSDEYLPVTHSARPSPTHIVSAARAVLHSHTHTVTDLSVLGLTLAHVAVFSTP